ncbi:DUF4442 domain-containing protein [Ochrovirga pacifica]|uniref:DUF4442 domain-containing protein n=1 Tax=Ochrovirga pacifica TaxID=1042376 RepID=UPI0002559D5B|nr:DUF4442 domain-containing protein [Ochrovirga pacifica]
MKLTAKQLNRFLFFKLPSAYWCGVRVATLTKTMCVAKVKLNWFNQNPFQSIYFAVLAMTAELATGALVIKLTRETGHKFSTLVLGTQAEFTKKAVGKIYFKCHEGVSIQKGIDAELLYGEGTQFTLESIGTDETGAIVASFKFTWSIKLKE